MPERRLPGGVYAASLTPQNQDLTIDFDALVAHCKWLLENGCNGVAPFGTTGEANSLSVAERADALDRMIGGGLEARRLLVGTGCCSIPDTVRLTRHAIEHDVGGVLVLPPFYYKGVSDDGLFGFFDRVIQDVADDRLEIYLYHFPKMAIVDFSDGLIERLISKYPDTIVGMKDSSGDWSHMERIATAFPGFRLFPGTEAFLLDALKIGFPGCISSTTNVTCRLAGEVFRAWRAGGESDATARLQQGLTSVRLALQAHAVVPALKRYLADQLPGHGWRTVRPPLTSIDDNAYRALTAELAALEFALT